MPTSARRTRSISSAGARPRSCSARSSASARARNGGSASRPCSSTSSPATRNTTARRGAIPTRNIFGWQRPCYLLGEGYAPSFKALMEETDVGHLRHRQLREMRQLHGALRLRADGGQRDRRPSAAGAQGLAARHPHRRPDGAGDRAEGPASGASTCSTTWCSASWPTPMTTRRRQKGGGAKRALPSKATRRSWRSAASLSRASRISGGRSAGRSISRRSTAQGRRLPSGAIAVQRRGRRSRGRPDRR